MRVSGEPARRACASPRRAVCSLGPLTASPRRGAITPGRWCNAAGAFCQAARAGFHLAGAVVCSPRRGHCRPGEAAPPEPCLWAKTTCASPRRGGERTGRTGPRAVPLRLLGREFIIVATPGCLPGSCDNSLHRILTSHDAPDRTGVTGRVTMGDVRVDGTLGMDA